MQELNSTINAKLVYVTKLKAILKMFVLIYIF